MTSSLRTRPSLLLRVRNWRDQESWQEFHQLYRKLIYGLARRHGLSHADSEDVCQDVFQRLAETIHEFESNPERGTFRGWVMNLTRWRIADRIARNARQAGSAAEPSPRSPGDDHTSTLERVPDPAGAEAQWDAEYQRHVLDVALERLARRIKPRHFQIFDLYVRRHWPVSKVAEELGTNPAAVYLIGHRLTRQLKAEVTKLNAQLG